MTARDLSRVGRLVFWGDGGPWIGSSVESLCEALDIDPEKIAQVLDYTPAKQNEIVDLVPESKQPENIAKKLKKLLWNGDIQGIHECICHVLKGQAKKERADYFLFLRSQLLSGRWLTFIQNVSRKWAAQINPQIHKNIPRKLLQAL